MASNLFERLQQLQQLGQDENLLAPLDINKGFAGITRDLQALSKRVHERNEAEAQQAQRRAADAAAIKEDELAADLAVDGSDDPAAKEAELKAIQQQVEKALLEDAEAVGVEPASHVIALHPAQAMPAPQLRELPVLQKLLALPEQLLGAEAAGINSSMETAEARAVEAFAWLLGQRQQLLVCLDEATAKAVFAAVWCSSSSSAELARAAYVKFLGWCGMSESQSGGDIPDVSEATWFTAVSSNSSDPSLLCGAPAFAEQQPPVTLQWLPGPDDFLQALKAMGCRMPAAAASATATPAGKRQQARSTAAVNSTAEGIAEGSYADANLPLLLGLLRHLCRLGVQGRLQVKLGGGNAPKELALLLMALMLDPRAGGSAAGRGLLQDALASLLAAASDVEWRRLQGQLLEALAPPGFGPSNRSMVLLLSLLPLTERCVCLRQQGALRLLGKLLPPKKQQQQQPRARPSWPAVHNELFQLLGNHPDKGLTQGPAPPSSSAGSSKKQAKQVAGAVDTWTLLDILDAANLLLWTDLVRPAYGDGDSGGVSGEVRAWFGSWMEKLERQFRNQLKFIRLRERLTELQNAYEFGSALGAEIETSKDSDDDE